jgi:hypothetical protein
MLQGQFLTNHTPFSAVHAQYTLKEGARLPLPDANQYNHAYPIGLCSKSTANEQ